MTTLRWIASMAMVGALTRSAHAGDRELNLVFSNFTPDAAADEASDLCVEQITKAVRDGYVQVRKVGESKLRGLMSKSQDGPGFISWPASAFDSAKQALAYPDALVLVDCRPASSTLRALVVPVDPRERRVLAQADLTDPETTRAIGMRLLALSWAGFTP